MLALDERELSSSLTAVVLDGSDELRRVILERFDMSLGAGLGKLQDQVFRIGHLGDFNDLMLAGTLGGVQMGLRLAGHDVGDGVGAALERLADVSGALDGVRVIELCQVMAGPFCGQVLGDMGADVIKVEPPGTGDQTRVGHGRARASAPSTATSASITLDLKDPGDVAILHRLVETADVLTENFRPGVAARLSADYETLRAINPRLIYASISGFGQTGPYAQRPGLRPDRPGRGGRDERHRRAGRQPGQGGRAGQRSLGRPVLRDRHPLRAAQPRRAPGRASGSTPRCGRARSRSRIWETAELWQTGSRAAAARLRAPPDRALPGAAHQGRPRHRRRQQPEAVAAAVRA